MPFRNCIKPKYKLSSVEFYFQIVLFKKRQFRSHKYKTQNTKHKTQNHKDIYLMLIIANSLDTN